MKTHKGVSCSSLGDVFTMRNMRCAWMLLGIALSIGACSDSDDLGIELADGGVVIQQNADATTPEMDAGESDAGEGEADAELQPVGFGGACTMDSDCITDYVCHSFGQLGDVCTKACSAASECPAGSMGQRCNMQGFCRP